MKVTPCRGCSTDAGSCIVCGDQAPNICEHTVHGGFVYLCSEHRHAVHLAALLRGEEIDSSNLEHDLKHLNERVANREIE